jgi:hypothetical protein
MVALAFFVAQLATIAYALAGLAFAIFVATDTLSFVLISIVFLRPVLEALEMAKGPGSKSLQRRKSFKKLQRAKRSAMVGGGALVFSNVSVYISMVVFFAAYEFCSQIPWLNIYVLAFNAGSICSDISMLVVAGVLGVCFSEKKGKGSSAASLLASFVANSQASSDRRITKSGRYSVSSRTPSNRRITKSGRYSVSGRQSISQRKASSDSSDDATNIAKILSYGPTAALGLPSDMSVYKANYLMSLRDTSPQQQITVREKTRRASIGGDAGYTSTRVSPTVAERRIMSSLPSFAASLDNKTPQPEREVDGTKVHPKPGNIVDVSIASD